MVLNLLDPPNKAGSRALLLTTLPSLPAAIAKIAYRRSFGPKYAKGWNGCEDDGRLCFSQCTAWLTALASWAYVMSL